MRSLPKKNSFRPPPCANTPSPFPRLFTLQRWKPTNVASMESTIISTNMADVILNQISSIKTSLFRSVLLGCMSLIDQVLAKYISLGWHDIQNNNASEHVHPSQTPINTLYIFKSILAGNFMTSNTYVGQYPKSIAKHDPWAMKSHRAWPVPSHTRCRWRPQEDPTLIICTETPHGSRLMPLRTKFVGYWKLGFFGGLQKNADLLRSWISTQIVTCIPQKQHDLLTWLWNESYVLTKKNKFFSHLDKMLGHHFEGEESQKPIPWKRWSLCHHWILLKPPVHDWLGTPTWEFQEMGTLHCAHKPNAHKVVAFGRIFGWPLQGWDLHLVLRQRHEWKK